MCVHGLNKTLTCETEKTYLLTEKYVWWERSLGRRDVNVGNVCCECWLSVRHSLARQRIDFWVFQLNFSTLNIPSKLIVANSLLTWNFLFVPRIFVFILKLLLSIVHFLWTTIRKPTRLRRWLRDADSILDVDLAMSFIVETRRELVLEILRYFSVVKLSHTL